MCAYAVRAARPVGGNNKSAAGKCGERATELTSLTRPPRRRLCWRDRELYRQTICSERSNINEVFEA